MAPKIGCNKDHRAEFETVLGRKVDWERIYHKTEPWPWNDVITEAKDYNVICSSTKNDTFPDVTAGKQDAYFKAIATGLAGLPKPGVYIFVHEPENPKKQNVPAEYRAAASHVFDVMGPILHPKGWRTAIALMGWTADPKSGRNPDDWYPTPTAPDIILFDSYSTLGAADGADCWGHEDRNYMDPAYLFGCCKTYAEKKGKPYGHAEVGAACKKSDATRQGQTDFWNKCADQKALDGNEFVSMFEMGCSDGFIESAIRSQPKTVAAFARSFPVTSAETDAEKIARLESEVAQLEADMAALQVELANQETANDALVTELSKTQTERDAALEKLAQINVLSS